VPVARAAGVERGPYDLRHSFVSLLIAEGHNVVEVARQAGHSPKVALDTYAHVFEEFDPAERINAADRIRNAREELRFRSQQPTLFDVA
jgi:integrase